MKRISLIIFMLSGILPLSAQRGEPCLTNVVTNELFKTPAQAEMAQQSFYGGLDQFRADKTSHQYKKGSKRIIPVVFHVIHVYGDENISKAQIEDQIRVLNLDFNRLNADASNTRSQFQADAADCEIEFRLATKDPNGNCTEGITRTYSTTTIETRDEIKQLIKWDNTKYLNIWVVKSIRPQTADQQGTTLGFAYLPWSLPGSKNVDGVVVRADYVGTIGTSSVAKGGRVLTHEIGHYLGLAHTFDNGCGSDCGSTGDRVCDTPPVADPSFGCDKNRNSCHNDSPDELDQIENFMDYADGNCQNMFTWGQKDIFDYVLTTSSYRLTLVSQSNLVATGTSTVTTPSCAPKADFSSLVKVICAGSTATFNDLSYNGTVTSRTWTFTGGNPSTSGDANPTVTYTTPGTYNVVLSVGNTNGSNQITRNAIIIVKPNTGSASAPFSEGFEGGTFPPTSEWVLTNTSESNNNWKRATTAKYAGNASAMVTINSSTPVNESSNLDLPAIDLTNIGNGGVFSMMVSYARRPSVASERLRLSYSTDCGNTFTFMKQWTGSQLASASDYSGSAFVPSGSGDWRELTQTLGNVTGNRKNVIFRLEVQSGGGNSVYVDNINITANGVTSAQVPTKENLDMSVFPNPAQNAATVRFTLPALSSVKVSVYDLAGRRIMGMENNEQPAGEVMYTINKNEQSLKDGLYILKIEVNGNLYTEKLVFGN